MLSDKPFLSALVISIIGHSLLFYQLPDFKILPDKKALYPLEVTYYKIEIPPEPKPIPKQKAIVVKSTPLVEEKIVVEKEKAQTNIQVEKEPNLKESPVKKEVVSKNEPLVTKKLPPEENIDMSEMLSTFPKEKQPIFLDYYQVIREKIRRFANYNYQSYSTIGEVCLFFILSSDGQLQQVKVLDDRSSKSEFLRKVASQSIKDASPFPQFPKGLERNQLSFNVIISFEFGD